MANCILDKNKCIYAVFVSHVLKYFYRNRQSVELYNSSLLGPLTILIDHNDIFYDRALTKFRFHLHLIKAQIR